MSLLITVPTGAHLDLGTCINDAQPARPYTSTITGQNFPELQFFTANSRTRGLFKTAKRVTLFNSDSAHIDEHVIVRNVHRWSLYGPTLVGRIVEILRLTSERGTVDFGLQYPDSVLIEVSELGILGRAYEMPSIRPSGYLIVVQLKVCLSFGPSLTLSQHLTLLRTSLVW